MKNIISILIFMAITAININATEAPKRFKQKSIGPYAIGVRFGQMTYNAMELSYKHFLTGSLYGQVDLNFANPDNYFEAGGFATIQTLKSLDRIDRNLYFFIGAGFGYYARRHNEDREMRFDFNHPSLTGIIGIEFSPYFAPIQISVDYKPRIVFPQKNESYSETNDIGVAIRYMF